MLKRIKNIAKVLLAIGLTGVICTRGNAQNTGKHFGEPVKEKETSMEKVVITRFLSDGSIKTDTIHSPGEIIVKTDKGTEPLIPKRYSNPVETKGQPKLRTIMTGLELSTALDLSSTDMSTFNADILFGYRNKAIQFLGVSVGVHKSLGSRDCFLPLQLVFRSGFQSRPTLMFMQLSGGYSFNTIARSPLFGDYMASIGAGVNLVQTRKLQSYIVLAFGFRHLNETHQELTSIRKPNLGFAQISFGISM